MDNNIETKLHIRKAVKEDIPLILSFIKEIAAYEKLSHEVVADEQLLEKSIFGDDSNVRVLLAYYNEEPAGYAVYFYNFSTFMGRRGLYLEDVFVKPQFRKLGIGKKLLIQLARIAIKNNCGRFEWAVLDWNTPAMDFYKSLGAECLEQWKIFRITDEALKKLSEK